MKTIKNRLTSLLTLKRNAFDPADTEADEHPHTHAPTDAEEKVLASQLQSKQAANDDSHNEHGHEDRPDWFQAIHNAEYYND